MHCIPHSHVGSQDSLHCTRLHTPSLLCPMFPCKLSKCFRWYSMGPSQPAWLTLPSMLPRCSQAQSWIHSEWHSQETWQRKYLLSYILLGAGFKELLTSRRLALGGRWQEAGGSGLNHQLCRYYCLNLIFSAATIVRSLMPYGHGVDHCHLTSIRMGRQFQDGENRSPTQTVLRNQLPASYRFWVYVCAIGPR